MNAQTASPAQLFDELIARVYMILLIASFGLLPTTAQSDTTQNNFHIGFVNNTYHYDRKHEYRESGHQGVAITWNELSMGTFITSDLDREDRAWFVSKSEPLTEHLSFIYGGAIGYNDIPIVPILGLSAKLAFFRVTLTPTVALFHIEIPIWAD